MKTRKRVMRKAPVAQPAQSDQPTKKKPNVSPQDQAMYDQTVLAARKVLFGDPNDDSRFKFVLQRLSGSKGQIGYAIGKITATVLANIAGTVAKQGKQVPGYILFHAGQVVIGDLIDIAVAAKLMDQSKAQETAKQAVMVALQAYREAEASAMSGGKQPQPGQPVQPAQPGRPPAPQQPQQPGIINAARGA